MKGIIALDIDGTLTTCMQPLSPKVAKYLEGLAGTGWSLLFITGRTFKAGHYVLKDLPFPYWLAVQNGAIILEMPSKRILSKKYLDRSIFHEMDQVCQGGLSDYVIYGGYENNDVCYFRPKRFSSKLLQYLEKRKNSFDEIWNALDGYEQMPLQDFPSVKCFGAYQAASELIARIEKRLKLHVPLIRDPFDENYYVVQATHPDINKGQALLDLIGQIKKTGRVIAAGDDNNDIPMLNAAHVKIAMATAPIELLRLADIIAPAASEEGIIKGLEAALKW